MMQRKMNGKREDKYYLYKYIYMYVFEKKENYDKIIKVKALQLVGKSLYTYF